MRFALILTFRELRSSWKRLLFFVLCLALGVGAIVVLRSTIQSVNAYTANESRAINSGDAVVRSATTANAVVQPVIERLEAEGRVVETGEYVELATMLGSVDGATAKIVELKAVDRAYPLYGRLTLIDGATYGPDLLAGFGAIVAPSLAAQLDIGVGDRVQIGGAEFTVRGLIEREPDSAIGSFSAGSRVLISRDDLAATRLLERPIRARSVVALRIPDGAYASTLADLRTEFGTKQITVRGYRETEANISSMLKTSADFLSLVGLAILVLGGVGIWSVTRVYIAERWKSIAILKCLGCTNRMAVSAYTLQMLAIGVAGSLVGVALAATTLAAVRVVLADGPLATIALQMTWSAIGQGTAVGVLVALLFSLTPLLGVSDIRPNLVLRAADPRRASRWNLPRILSLVVVAGGLLAVASWQGGSLRVGAVFLGGLATAAAASSLAGSILVRAVRAFGRVPVFALRHAALGINRPGNQTRAILVAIGLGVFFLVGVNGVERTILAALDHRRYADLPDLYLVDVQPDQVEGVTRLLERETGTTPTLVGTVRGRVVEIDGVPFEPEKLADPRERGRLGREFVLAARDELDATTETVVDGAWWGDAPSETPEVSVEEELARDYRLTVGRTITFDIQGRRIPMRVASTRRVDWQNARLGFMFVTRLAGLDAVQVVYNGATRGPEDPAERGRLARQLSSAYSNVSVVDARDIIASVTKVLSGITRAISIVGSLVLVSGLLILAGSVAMARYVRQYEIAVMKTLGARTRTLLGVLVAEHALLGALAGSVGSLLGLGLAWAACRWVFELPWQPEAAPIVVAIAAASVLTTAVGLVSSSDLLLLKPLPVLRRED